MSKIKIVTDSTADIPKFLLEKYAVSFVPLKVFFGEECYREDIDLSSGEFYEKLATFEGIPATSQPSPGEFCECYRELTADGSTVISIHISGALSGTIQSARIAASMLPEKEIIVVDSRLVCFPLGIVVLEAAKAAQAGKSTEQILEIIEMMINKIQTYFAVDTLEFLEKNGRIGKAASLLGTMLNLKPVLTIENGLIAPYEKVRGKSKAIEQMVKAAHKYRQENGPLHYFVFHGAAAEDAQKLKTRLKNELEVQEILCGEVGAVVGTHAGPGVVALFFYSQN